MSANVDQAFIRQMREKVERELNAREKECLEYWSAEVERLIKRRHQELAGLQNDLQTLLGRMKARIERL